MYKAALIISYIIHSYRPERPVGSIYCSDSSMSVVILSKQTSPVRVKHSAVLKTKRNRGRIERHAVDVSDVRGKCNTYE